MVLLFIVISFDCSFKATIFSLKMPSFNLRLINISLICIKWRLYIIKKSHLRKSSLHLYEFHYVLLPLRYVHEGRSKISPTKLDLITFLIRCCFDIIFCLLKTKSFQKMPNWLISTSRQCVVTLQMTFNTTWLWKLRGL